MNQEVRKALDWLTTNAAYHTSPDEAEAKMMIIEKALNGEKNDHKQ